MKIYKPFSIILLLTLFTGCSEPQKQSQPTNPIAVNIQNKVNRLISGKQSLSEDELILMSVTMQKNIEIVKSKMLKFFNKKIGSLNIVSYNIGKLDSTNNKINDKANKLINGVNGPGVLPVVVVLADNKTDTWGQIVVVALYNEETKDSKFTFIWSIPK